MGDLVSMKKAAGWKVVFAIGFVHTNILPKTVVNTGHYIK